MTVRLDKDAVVTLFCYCREAERSVHRALSAPWPDFQAYYGVDKTEPIRELVRRLAVAGRCPGPPASAGVLEMSLWPGFVRYFFGRWLVRLEKKWAFLDQEVCYILGRLEELLRLLTSPIKPESQALIALRMAFYDCERVIEHRCYGLREIEVAHGIDHFNKTVWLPQVTLTDVLKKSA